MDMKTNKSLRGFRVSTTDANGKECIVQESSSVDPRLWIGLVSAAPQIMCRDAGKVELEPEAAYGWQTYPIPEEVFLSTRMHLDEDGVRGLIKMLR